MVRTRGLGCALGQVTGRGIGRGDRDDSDDAPQLAVIADHVNEPVIPMPDVQDDPMEAPTAVEDIPADTRAEPAEDAHEGFLGGTSDPSVLTQYADHVACSVWTGEERPELKLSSHGRKVHSLGRLVPAIEGLIADTGDRGLLSAFVERWHRETFSFHLLVGELTITLDDVSFLLHLPVIGDLHAFEPLHGDDAVQMLVDLLMVSPESARTETVQCRGPYIRLQWVRDIYQRRCQAGHWTAAACAYLHHLLGCTLFANKSATNVHVVYLEALRDLSMTEMYAWGVAALVHMYDQLNDASCWIYEHFPSVAESTADQDYDEASPLACRWIATKKTVKSIRTPSYRERLDRLRIPDVYDDDDDYLVSNSYVEESLDEDDSVDGISDTDDEVTNIPQPVRIVHPAEGAQRIENPFWNHALHYNNINWSYPDEEDICGLEMSSTFNIGQELYVGMEFDSKDAVKNAVKQYVMKVHQSFKVVESKSNKYVVQDFHVRSCYSDLLHWGPVAVYYRPERVVRQFGYTQTIPAPPIDSWVSYDDIHDRWMHYEDHIVPAGEVCVVPGACSSDYIDWFIHISYPFMTPGHALDPLPHGHTPQPRVVPQAPHTDIPRVPEPGASSTSAEEPKHTMEVCDDIAERLERHLSLGVVTLGSSTHEVIEECLKLARSVTHDHLVYVRCRRRRRTDQA
ncbi:Protein MAIN-LIKE 1 [Glycine soja]